MELAKTSGAKMAKELVVSGAFHSPLMEPARESLFAALDKLAIMAPRCPIYANVSAAPTTEPLEIRRLLKEQLLSPVLWMHSMQAMIRDGAARFIEIGPGQVLTGLLKRIDRNVEALQAGTAEDMNRITA